jgi:hypothetical protein
MNYRRLIFNVREQTAGKRVSLKEKKNQIQAAEDAKFNYVGQRKSFCL